LVSQTVQNVDKYLSDGSSVPFKFIDLGEDAEEISA
jgi:hypothetical protein